MVTAVDSAQSRRVGVVRPEGVCLFEETIEGMRLEADLHGIDIVTIPDAVGDTAAELAQAETFLAAGVDGVILFSQGVNWDDFVQRAIEAGIYVFTYNPGPTTGATLNIRKQDGGAAALGQAAGAWINAKHGGDAKFAVLAHSSQAGRWRVEAMRNGVLGSAPTATPIAEIVAGSSADGARATEYLLKVHPDLRAILSFYDEPALGALEAAASAGRTDPDKFLIGGYMGITPALERIAEGGIYQATISFFIKFHGVQITRDMITCFHGEQLLPTRENRFQLITQENVEEHRKLLADPLAPDVQSLYNEIFVRIAAPLTTAPAHRT